MPSKAPCPHVTPAMIAAGFTTCAVCVDATATRIDKLAAAYTSLAAAFDAAADAAATQAKMCRRKRPTPDMDAWHAAARGVALAENDVDTATYDRATAGGEHG